MWRFIQVRNAGVPLHISKSEAWKIMAGTKAGKRLPMNHSVINTALKEENDCNCCTVSLTYV